VHIAEFEHFTRPADGEELNRMVPGQLGEGWGAHEFAAETSRHGKRQTFIFAARRRHRMGFSF